MLHLLLLLLFYQSIDNTYKYLFKQRHQLFGLILKGKQFIRYRYIPINLIMKRINYLIIDDLENCIDDWPYPPHLKIIFCILFQNIAKEENVVSFDCTTATEPF